MAHRTRLLPIIALFLLATTTLGMGCRRPAEGDKNGAAHSNREGEQGVAVKEVVLSGEVMKRAGLKIETATERPLLTSFRVPARVTFNDEATSHVGTPVIGRVVQIKVRIGDVVQNGDDLLVIESRELGEAQSYYLQKRAAMTVAQESTEAPKAALERAKSLMGKAISGAEVQKREAEYRATAGNLRNAEVAVATAKQKLRLLGMDEKAVGELETTGVLVPNHVVRAPISGTVIQREVTLGEPVIPEKQTLLILADLSTLWIIADVPETKLMQVVKGALVRVHASLISEHPLEGIVALVPPSINLSTRTTAVRIEVKDGRSLLTPGMFVEAEIFDGRPDACKPVLAIPEAAMQTVEGETVVFVPRDDDPNRFAKRTIQHGREVDGMVEVRSGVRAGDKIVTTGSLLLKGELGKAGAAQDDD